MGLVNFTVYITPISGRADADKFVVSMVGEAYAAKSKSPNRKCRRWPFDRHQINLS